jgi:sortase A
VAIAGHRTTYLAPFRHVDQLKSGDRITLTMPYGRFTYEIQKTQIVLPTALWVTKSVGYDRLVLSACHPLYSASHRIIVFARLINTEARGAAAD